MKHRVVLSGGAVVLLGALVLVACSDDSGSPASPSPDGTNDGGSSSGATTDGGANGDTSTTPPLPTYETWRLIKNPTEKGDWVTSIAANAEQVFFSGFEGDETYFVESRNVGTGAPAWRVAVPKATVLAANATYVATGDDNDLTLRKASDGSVVWTKPFGRPISQLFIDDAHVIAGGTFHAQYPSNASAWSIQSYDLGTGNTAWTNPVGASSSYSDYLGGFAVTADALYVSYTSADGPYTKDWRVLKRPMVGGQPQSSGGWAMPLTNTSYNGAGGIVADAQHVYVSGIVSDSRIIASLNPADGMETWRKTAPATLPFSAGLLFGGEPFLDPGGVLIFGAQQSKTKRSASYLLAAADGTESRVVEHFAGAMTAAVANGHLFLGGTVDVVEAGTDTQWQVDNVKYADGQISATNHIELK